MVRNECFYYCYNLLDNEIISEKFKPADFKPEKASLRIMTTREQLSVLFSSEPILKVLFLYMCTRQ